MGGRVQGLTAWDKVLLFCLVLLPSKAVANWMYLGVVSSLATTSIHKGCDHMPGLDFHQQKLCQKNPQAMPCVGEGAKKGIHECHYQFKYERWNCSTTRNESVFGNVLYKGTKETAFVYSVTSAGIVHALTYSCSAGNITDCTCDMSRVGEATEEGWKWGGCSDNIKYGLFFNKKFVDEPEQANYALSGNVKSLMNLHNNEVGRKAIEKLMHMKCRCHGVSGSCAVRTCWKVMPSFREVGAYLKKKYENSVEAAPRSMKILKRRSKVRRKVPIRDDELVHIYRSPNYCRKDSKKGIPGTRGRECKKNTRGPDSCDMLCCGRGYNTRVDRFVDRCQCKFVWCCEVQCKTCETMVDKHTCK